MLPRSVRIPDVRRFLRESPGLADYFHFPTRMLEALPEIRVEVDPTLERPWGMGLPMVVDGVPIVIDVSDFAELDTPYYWNLSPPLASYPLVLRMHYVESMRSLPNLGSFPQMSFYDWALFERLAAEIHYDPHRSDRVVHIQRLDWARGPNGPAPRRDRVHRILREALGDRLEGRWTDSREVYWRKAADCLVSVHVPGSWNNMLDRGQFQYMAFGACTISPELFDYVLTERPVAGEHYLRCRDDYADLPEQVAWCGANRDECARIGRNAARFFREHATPRVVWSHIRARLDGLRGHAAGPG